MMAPIRAPFTPEQVEALNRWQQNPKVHPFTCGSTSAQSQDPKYPHMGYQGRVLVAKEDGWHCPSCGYTQDWAHDFMAVRGSLMAEQNKLAHLYAQKSEHDEAYLIANTQALYEILRALGEALGTGNAAVATLMTADGEEFELIVVREDSDWRDDIWQKALLPYTEGSGDGSGLDPWEHPAVRRLSEQKKKEQMLMS